MVDVENLCICTHQQSLLCRFSFLLCLGTCHDSRLIFFRVFVCTFFNWFILFNLFMDLQQCRRQILVELLRAQCCNMLCFFAEVAWLKDNCAFPTGMSLV